MRVPNLCFLCYLLLTILTADFADTREWAQSPHSYLSARIRVIRGSSVSIGVHLWLILLRCGIGFPIAGQAIFLSLIFLSEFYTELNRLRASQQIERNDSLNAPGGLRHPARRVECAERHEAWFHGVTSARRGRRGRGSAFPGAGRGGCR